MSPLQRDRAGLQALPTLWLHEAAVSGLLIAGVLVDVPGVVVLSPGEQPWARLSPADCRPRSSAPQQWILHKTIADDPEEGVPGAGPSAGLGGAEDSAKEWAQDDRHSGAHIIVGFAGATVCLADLARVCAYHDGNFASNLLSVGLEMKEHSFRPARKIGGCYEATYAATVKVTCTGMSALGIQWQCPTRYVNNTPLPRFTDGGKNLVGAFGHRDASGNRGRWDPGDRVFDMLEDAGFERFDFYGREDLDTWSKRQERLRSLGFYKGPIDGIPGRGTTLALKQAGYPDGIYARWREMAERPIAS